MAVTLQALKVASAALFLACLLTGAAAAAGPSDPASLGGAVRRVEATFDYGWRFTANDDPLAHNCSDNSTKSWPTSLTGKTCSGLVDIAVGRKSVVDCYRGCCADPACVAYQWRFQTWSTDQGGCYVNLPGTNFSCHEDASSEWVGGQRPQAPAVPDYTYAAPGFDDGGWQSVDAPHDFVVTGEFEESADAWHGYLPRNVSWYRKTFTLPEAWGSDGGVTYMYSDGVFHRSEWFLNGKPVGVFTSGYVPFTVPLTAATFDGKTNNVLAARVDASYGSGHWYEGGGIYRPVTLVHAAAVNVAPNGLNFQADTTCIAPASSKVAPSVEVFNNGTAASTLSVQFTLTDSSGSTVGRSTASQTVPAGSSSVVAGGELHAAAVTLWSVQTPTLYTLTSNVLDSDGNMLDTANASVGFRCLDYNTADGFQLNGERVRFRGFSNHNSFTGIGVAVSPRVDLFKVQGYRAMGANVQRMSHNPPVSALLDLTDRLGVMVWNEARDFGPQQRFLHDFSQMVKRDRNHASVAMTSFCNEIECQEATNYTGKSFRSIAKALDAGRPVTANTVGLGIPSELHLAGALDILGLSHRPRADFEYFHDNAPYSGLPLISSESSSCMTQRGMNAANLSGGVFFPAWNGACLFQCFNKSFTAYNGGELGVWTAHDYIGEPGRPNNKWGTVAWPHVSSSFGQIDLAGFVKPHAAWYRSSWLTDVASTDAGRPPLPSAASQTVVIAEVWDPQMPATTFHVFSSSGMLELQLNGKVVSGPQKVQRFDTPIFDNVQFTSGNLTAVLRDSSGAVVASHTRLSCGEAVAIRLSVDAPSPTTGTGAKLVLDGHDQALIRATIVDASGNQVHFADNAITFSVSSGPGHLAGVGSGNPASHERMQGDTRKASAGLARAVIGVNVDAVSEHRGLITATHPNLPLTLLPNGNAGSKHVYVARPGEEAALVQTITVTAESAGLKSDTIEIPTSIDVDDSVLAVAARSVQQAAWQP